MSQAKRSSIDDWPELEFGTWSDTAATLHLWTQIVGKIRLSQTPWTNHSWHVPLYVNARGLTSSPIYHGSRAFEISFDFIDHRLLIATADGAQRTLPLEPRSVADFYQSVMDELRALPHRTLVVRGKDDLVVPHELGVELATLLPDARLVEADDCGHSVAIERPNWLAQQLLAHFAD